MATIGRYRLDSELGRGASGVVYLAHDPRVQRPVAAKAFAMPDGLSDSEQLECRERFLREARAAGGLSHPGIVTIYDADYDEERGVPFIAMEYVPGRSLQAALRERGPFPLERAVDLAAQLADALQAAHVAGVIHRDVKPANVLLRDDDTRAKLADFGVARLSTSELTRSGTTVGSPAYMSPEQIRGGEVDGRSDLFSLAAILYETIAGRRPFVGEDVAALVYSIAHEDPEPLAGRVPGVGAALDGFFRRALAKDPAERFQDAGAFVAALRRAAGGAAVEPAGGADGDAACSTGRRPAEMVAPDEDDGRLDAPAPRSLRPVVIVAAVLLILVAGGRSLLGTGQRATIELEGRSMVPDGTVTVLVEGRRVWSRDLEIPEARRSRLGRVLDRRSETFEATFDVPAGSRTLAVRLERAGHDPVVEETGPTELEAGERRRMSLVLGRPLGPAIGVTLH